MSNPVVRTQSKLSRPNEQGLGQCKYEAGMDKENAAFPAAEDQANLQNILYSSFALCRQTAELSPGGDGR